MSAQQQQKKKLFRNDPGEQMDCHLNMVLP